MKRIICTIVDSAAQAHSQPMTFVSIGVAVRSFTDEVNRVAADNPYYQHPDDYTLMHVADFDEETGTLSEPEEGRRVLCRGKDVFAQKVN